MANNNPLLGIYKPLPGFAATRPAGLELRVIADEPMYQNIKRVPDLEPQVDVADE